MGSCGSPCLCRVLLADAVDDECDHDAEHGEDYHIHKDVLVAGGARILVELVADEKVHEGVGQIADNGDDAGRGAGHGQRHTGLAHRRVVDAAQGVHSGSKRKDNDDTGNDVVGISGQNQKNGGEHDLKKEEDDAGLGVGGGMIGDLTDDGGGEETDTVAPDGGDDARDDRSHAHNIVQINGGVLRGDLNAVSKADEQGNEPYSWNFEHGDVVLECGVGFALFLTRAAGDDEPESTAHGEIQAAVEPQNAGQGMYCHVLLHAREESERDEVDGEGSRGANAFAVTKYRALLLRGTEHTDSLDERDPENDVDDCEAELQDAQNANARDGGVNEGQYCLADEGEGEHLSIVKAVDQNSPGDIDYGLGEGIDGHQSRNLGVGKRKGLNHRIIENRFQIRGAINESGSDGKDNKT